MNQLLHDPLKPTDTVTVTWTQLEQMVASCGS